MYPVALTCIAMETGAGSEASEAEILESISQEPPHPPPAQPPAGKLRKTAFKFFSSRKSICVLPSFFGGLGKGQGRGSSKTGVTKSRTHDGVSRGCWDDAVRGSGDVAAGDFEFRTQRDSGGGSDLQKGTETVKSQLLPWQRRGFRGLFSSIRRHRRSKNVEVEKISSLEMSASACNVPVGYHSNDRLCGVLEPVVPDSANGREGVMSAATECMKVKVLVPERRKGVEGSPDEEEEDEKKSAGEAAAEGSEVITRGVPSTYRQLLCAESELARLAEQNPEGADGDPPAVSLSSDHTSLVFGDVSSLKSFDSLTGCGDIIADQDDDSVAESSVSGERGSRSAGKRSSCLVTYQGGGEEMAMPDEVDGDYLQDLWEGEDGNEVCYVPAQQDDSLPITPDQPISSLHTITISSSSGGGSSSSNTNSSNTNSSPLGVLETVLSPGDLMTPQSEHQESVPNSDEGYYDSTTPGADEDARDRARPERLPRDSYSGDALYELFEPDDRLLSPTLPDGDPCAFLGVPLPGSVEGKGSPVYSLKTGAMDTCAMETEEDRLSKIQQALLCCELQSLRKTAKEPLLFNRGPYYPDSDLPLSNCKVGKKQVEEPLSPRGTRLAPVHHALEDAPLSDGGSGPQTQDNPTYSQIPSPLHESEAYLQRDQCSPPTAHPYGPSLPCSQSQEELTVCFSQALVDFTKHSHVYCNSTESLDGSESSSPFGQNLQALPAIVTFDIVDMENEGEFEHQTELIEGKEELASAFEPFEDESCYLQKDAFAECDERMFDPYEQSLLLGNTWGITSLPRHLSSARGCQPTPAPLALNRRSRSLDTDSLELCANVAPTRAPYEPARTGSLHRRKNGHLPVGGPSQPAARDGRRHGHGQDPPSISNAASLCQKPPSACPPTPETRPAGKPALQTAVRPSDLPLQARPSYCGRGREPAQPAVSGTSAGGNGAFLAAGQPPGQGGVEVFYHCGFAEAGHLQGKARPVGVTQGVPHAGGGPGPWARSDKEGDVCVGGKSMKAVEVGYGPAQTKRST